MKLIIKLFLLAMAIVLAIGAQGFAEEAVDWVGWLSTIAVMVGAGCTVWIAVALDKLID